MVRRFFESIFFTHFRVLAFNLFEEIKVCLRYYKNSRFLYLDLAFRACYFWKNPYRMCKKMGFLYGETPLTTMDHIAKTCQILSKDIFFDLGCGRGRNLFWLAHFVQCQTYGIDLCDEFIQRADFIKNITKMFSIFFQKQDFLETDFSKATFIYLYGTTLPDTIIHQLIAKLRVLDTKTQIITVSYSLNEYCNELFEVKKEFQAVFPWGTANVYLQSPKISYLQIA